MDLQIITGEIFSTNVDLLGIPMAKGEFKGELWNLINRETDGLIERVAKEENFRGEEGRTLLITLPNGNKVGRLALIGLGDLKKVTNYHLRSVGAVISRTALERNLTKVGFVLDEVIARSNPKKVIEVIAQGLLLGSYRFIKYLTGDNLPKNDLKTGIIVIPEWVKVKIDQQAVASLIKEAQIINEGISLARDLVNEPAEVVNPIKFAELALTIAEELNLNIKVFDKKELEKEGMNLILAVNRGSNIEPRLVHLKYSGGEKSGKRVAIVGKGITFDSGGLQLKTPTQMSTMKCDMAGGAVALALIKIASKLALKCNIDAVIPLTENVPGKDSIKPGDIIKSYSGKTVEIVNTDAEGRLILADALSYIAKEKPHYIIDVATLTGSCMVALGEYTAGIFAKEEKLSQAFYEVSKESGESFWPLPYNTMLRELLKSDLADIKNGSSSNYGGAIVGALFLGEFVPNEINWIHLDIAGPAFLSNPKGFYPKGGTGFGILTILEFIKREIL